MSSPSAFATVWLKQAENDRRFARNALDEGFFAQCCFVAQQASEKALKSIILARNLQFPFSHSLTELCRSMRLNGKLLQAAAVLDLYCVTARYPSGATAMAPFELINKAQATEALSFARRFILAARAKAKRSRAR